MNCEKHVHFRQAWITVFASLHLENHSLRKPKIKNLLESNKGAATKRQEKLRQQRIQSLRVLNGTKCTSLSDFAL